jgi:hypothetical protein
VQDRYGNTRYKRWLEVLEKNPSLLVKGESARELRSVDDLVDNGFLVVSEGYLTLVYEEEERKKGAGHAALRGRPDPGSEDKAALHRAKAEAKARSLQARRLQRHLEELREQNRRKIQKLEEQYQRRIEKLREQHQRRIERLARRLARTKKRAKKKNRALTNQLRSIRASRSWKVIYKLARLRAKVLGRTSTKQDVP